MEDFQNISDFIKENNLESFTDIGEDLICIICRKIMVNATIAPCRCRYCYKCIETYLKKKNKCCPGSAKYCKIDSLNFKRDITTDKFINNRILKLIVKCPQKTCEFKSELNLIKEHLEICDKRFVECPYLQMGCNKEDVQLNDVKTHLHDDSFTHNKLLIEYINNFKNDIEILKNNIKKEIINNTSMAERKELELNEKIDILENQNKTMKDEMCALKSEIEILWSMQNNQRLKNSLEIIEEKQKLLEEDVINGNNKITVLSEKSDKLLPCFFHVDKVANQVKDKLEDLENQFLSRKDEEFVWKIDNILEKVKQIEKDSVKTFYSDLFYTHKNGYVMHLYLISNLSGKNKGFLGLFFKLVKGPFDDILPWPCRIDVTTDLLNQDSGRTYSSRTCRYETNKLHEVYRKPICGNNKGFGSFKFIKLSQLLAQEQLVKNNQLFVKCKVHLND